MKVKSESEAAQSCPTLRNPMDCSLPGSSVHGIFQARVLKWGAIPFCFLVFIHASVYSPRKDSEKAGLKFNIQITKIMASGPITSWEIDGEMETVADFIFWGSKITADGDCSHEIKRHPLFPHLFAMK